MKNIINEYWNQAIWLKSSPWIDSLNCLIFIIFYDTNSLTKYAIFLKDFKIVNYYLFLIPIEFIYTVFFLNSTVKCKWNYNNQ